MTLTDCYQVTLYFYSASAYCYTERRKNLLAIALWPDRFHAIYTYSLVVQHVQCPVNCVIKTRKPS